MSPILSLAKAMGRGAAVSPFVVIDFSLALCNCYCSNVRVRMN